MTTNPIPRFPKDSRVCFLGDSMTSGALWCELIFEYYLEKFPGENIRVFDAGVGGGTARFGIENLEKDLYTFDPTHVMIMYCANDINGYTGTDDEKCEKFRADLHELTDKLLERGIVVYFGIPPYSTETYSRELSVKVMKQVAEEYGFPYTDFYELTKTAVEKADILQPDGVHMNTLGDSVMARIFLHNQGFEGFSPDCEDFLTYWNMTRDGDLRHIYNKKIRCVWLAIRNISTTGDTMDAKIDRLKKRIVTWADGAWDDFSYFRAVDFIELAPHMEFYRMQFDRLTDMMVEGKAVRP